MKILIVEDEMTSRLLLRKMLEPYGDCDVAVNGREAVEVVCNALDAGKAYDLVCLDIMMPEMDGQAALTSIREHEAKIGCLPSRASKIVMTTALNDIESVTRAYSELCDGYLVKPLRRDKLVALLAELKLLGGCDDELESGTSLDGS
jgi:two-component system, chemotaxis family, chemotaxis protein CheY